MWNMFFVLECHWPIVNVSNVLRAGMSLADCQRGKCSLQTLNNVHVLGVIPFSISRKAQVEHHISVREC